MFSAAFYVMQKRIAAPWPLRCYLSGSSEFHRDSITEITPDLHSISLWIRWYFCFQVLSFKSVAYFT